MLAESGSSLGMQAVGWLGQACFFSRFFLQWLASERAKSSVVPRAFWWLSLAGAVLMSSFALDRGTMLLLFGYLVSGGIALRNLWLQGRKSPGVGLDPRWSAAIALALVATSIWIEVAVGKDHGNESLRWLVVGGVGQALWVTRFPLQWWYSERAGHSHFPVAFWWISLAGNLLLLAYALHLGILVFVLGFVPGPLLQVRNLMLSRRSLRTA